MGEYAEIPGSCHCGNIRFTLSWPSTESTILVRKCGCSFCRKHAGAWTSHRDSALAIHVEDPQRLSRYGFGTKTADFCVCAVCGVVPLVLSEIETKRYAIVNVNTFEHAGDFLLAESPMDFDGEDVGSRLERRVRNWIPDVRFDE